MSVQNLYCETVNLLFKRFVYILNVDDCDYNFLVIKRCVCVCREGRNICKQRNKINSLRQIRSLFLHYIGREYLHSTATTKWTRRYSSPVSRLLKIKFFLEETPFRDSHNVRRNIFGERALRSNELQSRNLIPVCDLRTQIGSRSESRNEETRKYANPAKRKKERERDRE